MSTLPPLNAVRAFVAAARHQSFKLAAHELHVTDGAVSRQVKALERYLGVSLFERRVRQVVLTAEGMRFMIRAEAALVQLASAAEELMTRVPSRVVRINVRPSFAVCWLIPRLPDFVRRYPGIEPRVITNTRLPQEQASTFDVTIRRGLEGWPASVEVHPFLEDEVHLVGLPAWFESDRRTMTRALASRNLLVCRTRQGDWDAWRRHVGLSELAAAAELKFDHMHFVLRAAVDGLGFAMAPLSLVLDEIVSGRLCSLFPQDAMPTSRYFYGITPGAGAEAHCFVHWLEGELAEADARAMAAIDA